MYQAPSRLLPDIRLVRTDIAGFFGFAERGPLPNPDEMNPGERAKVAVKVTSWSDFRLKFGGFLPYSYLAYAVRGFFATGGKTCYVVRVGVAATPAATAFMPLPAAGAGETVATPITSILTATVAGQSRIRVDCSQVIGMEEGRPIAIGDPITGECVAVASVIDDRTITVQPPLQSAHGAREAVYAIAGSVATKVDAGSTTVQVGHPEQFSQGDLVSIEGGGTRQIRVVTAPPTGSTIQLGLALKGADTTGALIRKYATALTVSARSEGSWGNGIKLEITPLEPGSAVRRFSLRVTVDRGADPMQPVEQEFYPLLSLDPEDPSAAKIYAPDVVNNLSAFITLHVPTKNAGAFLLVGSGPLRTNALYLEGGADGAPAAAPVAAKPVAKPCSGANAGVHPTSPVTPSSQPPSSQAPDARDQDFLDALDVLGLIDEIAIVCCPDAAEYPGRGWSMAAIQQAMMAECARLRYRVAVLDTPMSLHPAGALDWLKEQGYSDPVARFAAVYYPWLKVPESLGVEGATRKVPPCGHVAGAYAFTDNESGVQKPPANVELHFISDVELAVTGQQQGFLNSAGINAIRPIAGRGIRVWGARAISRERDWTFIHTRRLMSMIEDSVEQASRWVVFQGNDDDLRRTLTHSLNVFLESIRLTGGLKGLRASDSYFVKCDRTNNPPASVEAGQLICQIGVAIAAPMEFLVFELRRSVAGAQVEEA